MPLSDLEVKNAKPREEPYRLKDENGLFLHVRPSGKKKWRFRYWLNGKESLLSLGEYPLMSLKGARLLIEEARKMVAAGRKPELKKMQGNEEAMIIGVTFGEIAKEFIEKRRKESASVKSFNTMESRMRRYVLPHLGSMKPDEITPPLLLSVIRRIEAKGILESAHRTLGVCGQVFRYAIATGRASSDPTRDLRGALEAPKEKHHASLTTPKEVGELMRGIDEYLGSKTVQIALLITAYTFVRQSELRFTEWPELDQG